MDMFIQSSVCYYSSQAVWDILVKGNLFSNLTHCHSVWSPASIQYYASTVNVLFLYRLLITCRGNENNNTNYMLQPLWLNTDFLFISVLMIIIIILMSKVVIRKSDDLYIDVTFSYCSFGIFSIILNFLFVSIASFSLIFWFVLFYWSMWF